MDALTSAVRAVGRAPASVRAHVRAHWAEVLFTALLALGIALDLWLVFNGYKSISLRTWVAQRQHPTLAGAGNLATVGAAYLVRRSKPCVFVTGLLGGHLFLHY